MRFRIIFFNLLTFIAGPLLAIATVSVLERFSAEDILTLYLNPFLIAFLILGVLCTVLGVLFFLRKIDRWLETRVDTEMETAQRAIIIYQKLSIYLPIILSLITGIILPRVSPILEVGLPPGFLMLCVSLTFLVSLFSYILYIQNLEQYTWDLPFSHVHRSMPYQTRVLLIAGFTTLGSLGLIIPVAMIAVENSGNISSMWFSLTITVMSVLVIFFVLADNFILAKGISGRLSAVRDFTQKLAEGDLTCENLPTMSRDEFGELIDSCNRTQSYLSGLVTSLKSAVEEAYGAGESLVTAAQETSQALGGISSGTREVDEGMGVMMEEVDHARELLESLTGNIDSVALHIDEQAAMSEQSTAALKQMNKSVGTINTVARERLTAAESLAEYSSRGGDNLNMTLSAVTRIHQGINTITEITDLIGNIAGQTNLLAMNAAIEAAHAGEAGRGFSVVADEIRKLAESTGQNSRRINDAVSEIVDSIERSSELGGDTAAIFESMDAEMRMLVESLKEIEIGVAELGVGTGEVLESMNALKDHSQGLREDSGSMKKETDSVGEVMGRLETASRRVHEAGGDIAGRTGDALKTEERLEKSTTQFSEVAVILDQRVKRFKT